MNGSYIQTMLKMYNCNNWEQKQGQQFAGVEECAQYYLAKHMRSLDYQQLYVDLRKKSIYKLISDEDEQLECLNFEIYNSTLTQGKVPNELALDQQKEDYL
jgi:hypothetical protein